MACTSPPWGVSHAEPIGSRLKVCQPRDFHRHPPKGAFFFALFYLLTRKRVYIFFDTQLFLFVILSQSIFYVLLSITLFLPRCLHNTLGTKSLCFRIYISCSHTFQISLNYFSLLGIPLFVINYIWAVLILTYVYDPYTPPLLLSLLLRMC